MQKKVFWILFVALCVMTIICLWNRNEYKENGHRKVYAVLPLTGSFGVAGKTIQSACAVCEHKQPFDLIYVDSESSSAKALTAVNQATINEQDPIIIAGATFASTAIISAYNEHDKGFVFATITPNVSTLDGKKNFQRVSYGSDDVVTPIIKSIFESECGHIAVIYEDSEHGNILKKSLEKRLIEQNKTKLADLVAYSPAANNMKDVVAKVNLLSIDAVIVFGGPSLAYVNIFKELKETFKFKGLIYADISFGNEFVYASLGDSANGIRFVCHDSDLSEPLTEKGRKFRTHCINHKIPTNYISVQIFDVIGLIDYMIEHEIPFTQSGLAQIGTYQGVGGTIKFDGKGGCYYHMILASFNNGMLNPVK